jgi:anthranilate phosphoribosyltransferase
MMRQILARLASRQDLSRDEARSGLLSILAGEATPAQIASFATALKVKGETLDEIVGCAQAMREHMVRVQTPAGQILDTCGTGGDGRGTLNISTVAAIVAAAGGITVAKHGNRAASSKSGSADLLEQLGVRIDPPVATVERSLREIGFAFLFAPTFHPALKHAAPVRKELGFRTIFNILGPLCNPAGATIQILGVPSPDLIPVMARALIDMGSNAVMVFHSADGLDEISPCGPTTICFSQRGQTPLSIEFTPEEAGLTRAHPESIAGGGPEANADRARALLKGAKDGYRDAVILNSAACFALAGLDPDLRAGSRRAAELIDSGRALRTLEKLAELSRG